jgi:hypothetical protein
VSSKFKITIRKSKDPSIEEYYAVIWKDGSIVESTGYHSERSEARAEANELIELIENRDQQK